MLARMKLVSVASSILPSMKRQSGRSPPDTDAQYCLASSRADLTRIYEPAAPRSLCWYAEVRAGVHGRGRIRLAALGSATGGAFVELRPMSGPTPQSATEVVTMLFTDIEGSSDGVRTRGIDRWEDTLERHTTVIREALAAHGGVEVRSEGDAFFVVFARPTAAVAAAAAIQRGLAAADWPDGNAVRVRMGLHTGEARRGSAASGVDYVGFEITRAARIAAAGHGGQVLVSDTTESLVRDALDRGLALVDLGDHRFKDLIRPQRIYQLLIEGLPEKFPALRTLDATPNNLPTQITTFIGRERELESATALLKTTRLLTLTGPGGTGKTRLALQLAAEVASEYADGAWLAELASVTDPAAVGLAVGAALNFGERPGQATVEWLSAMLRGRRLLLILDNCEHLIAACAELADALLHACPRIVILATSREGLNVPGETLMPIPSLRVPGAGASLTTAELGEYEAVRLFVDRCAARQPGFMLSTDNAEDITRICSRLDGVPLALELAAARVRVLSLGQVAQRLDDRFRLLTGGGRTVVARQQTLRALIDWSYDLLSQPERQLLRRLSVFVSGWSLEAAESVCAGDGIEREVVLELLSHLVDKSLVVMDSRGGAARYSMLESIREYAREKLVGSGEAPAARRRHFEHFFVFAEAWGRGRGADMRSLSVGIEYENLVAARDWIAAEPGSTELELQMTARLVQPAQFRGRIGELRDLLRAALGRADPGAPTVGRAEALLSLAIVEGMLGDVVAGARHHVEAVGLFRSLGRKHELAVALTGVARLNPDAAEALRAFNEARSLFQEVGDRWGLAMLLFLSSDAAVDRGDFERAESGHTESLDLFRGLGSTMMATQPMLSLGRLASARGDHDRARAWVEEALAIRRRPEFANVYQLAIALNSLAEVERAAGEPARARAPSEEVLSYGRLLGSDMRAWALHNLGHVALAAGDLPTAAARFRESMVLRQPLGASVSAAGTLAGLAGVALRQGDLIAAAWLFGSVDAMLSDTRTVLPPGDEQVRRRDDAALRGRLADADYAAAYDEGNAADSLALEAMTKALMQRVGSPSA